MSSSQTSRERGEKDNEIERVKSSLRETKVKGKSKQNAVNGNKGAREKERKRYWLTHLENESRGK